MTYTYDGEVVLVTGGTGALGQAMVRRLRAEGLKVALTYAHQKATAERLVEENGGPGQVLALRDEGTTLNSVRQLVEQVNQKWGSIHFLVNNAGIIRDVSFVHMEEEDWQKVLAVNLEKALAFCRAVIFDMVKAKQGTIVNISSVAALAGSKGQVNYASAKAGLLGMTKALAREFGRHGLRINALAPGYIESAMTASLGPAKLEEVKGLIPLRRLGHPEEVAAAAAFLLSREAGYVTGQTLVIDGGLVMN